MVVTSAQWYDRPLDRVKATQVLQERMIDLFPRFSQRVVEDRGLWWEDVADFDIRDRIHELTLSEPAGRAEDRLLLPAVAAAVVVLDGHLVGVRQIVASVEPRCSRTSGGDALTDQRGAEECACGSPDRLGASSHELGDLMGSLLQVTGKLAQRRAIDRAGRLQGRGTNE